MTNDQLQQLRARILSDVVPLVVSSSDEIEKFDITLRLIQSGSASQELYQQAYESAKSIPDDQEKLGALMALLDEVELDLGTNAEGTMEPDVAESTEGKHDTFENGGEAMHIQEHSEHNGQ